MLHLLLQQIFKMESLCMDTSPKTSSPLINRLIVTNSCILDQTTLRHCCSCSVTCTKNDVKWSPVLLRQILLPICHLKVFKLVQILKKHDSLCRDPFLWLSSSAIEGCDGNKVSWYPVLSELIIITCLPEDQTPRRFIVPKFINID